MLHLAQRLMRDLYLIRHGQSEGNVDPSVYYTKPDSEIELTIHGKKQAHECGQTLSETLGDSPEIYFSPYRRAYETANLIAKQFKYATLEECDLLRERTWGYLREIVDGGLKTDDHFKFFYRPFGGESFADAHARAILFLNKLRAHPSRSPVIIVSHGEWIRVALMHINKLTIAEFEERRKNPYNCQIIKAQF